MKRPVPLVGTDIRPPNPPWIRLEHGVDESAALSFYYSDPRSQTPVREVTHPNDPKADPSIETLTFGLFSTCDKGMRAHMVRWGLNRHFFCTRRGDVRVLTGYYVYGWYCEIPRPGSGDYALAATKARFVSPGFPLSDLTGYLRGKRIDNRFRTYRYIDSRTASLLLLLLDYTPDATRQYISEIHRLERDTLQTTGTLYGGKSAGFSWDNARRRMGLRP